VTPGFSGHGAPGVPKLTGTLAVPFGPPGWLAAPPASRDVEGSLETVLSDEVW
jgi:hypothetical protein